MPSITVPSPFGGGIQQCIAELGVNLALIGAVGQRDNAANNAALLEALTGPFSQIVKQIKDIIMGSNGILAELQTICNEFIPTSVEQLMQMMKNAPTRLVGGIVNAADTLISQLYQYGSSEVGKIIDQFKQLFQGLLIFNPESILGMAYQALVFGLPSVLLQKVSLKTMRKLVKEINSEFEKGKVPKQISPNNPFSESIEELCKAKKHYEAVEKQLLDKATFNKGECTAGMKHIFRARDVMIDGKNSGEFLANFATKQFGVTVEELASRKWMPPIKIALNKEGIIALMMPISVTNNAIKTMQDNIASLMDKFRLNFKFENMLVLFIRFIKNEIARYQNALLAATGDPNGNIQQWENNREMKNNTLRLMMTNRFASQAEKDALQLEITALDKQIKEAKQKVAKQSPEEYKAPSLINSLAVQLEVAIGLSILGEIARAICMAMDKLEKIFSKITSLGKSSWIKKFNDILDGFNPANCPDFYGNVVLCGIGKYLDALNARLTLQNSDDSKVINLGKELLKYINKQLLYLDCIEKKLTNGSKEVLAILLALGLAALVASLIMNGLSLEMILSLLNLDFDLWFLKMTASSFYEAILKALVCIIQSCDNPGMTRYANQLMTKIHADKSAEDTRNIDFRHMGKEAQFNDTFSTNSRIKVFMDIIAMISSFSFSLCIPGSSKFDKTKTNENLKKVKQGQTFERAFCEDYAVPSPQSGVLGNDQSRVQRVYA